MSRMTKRATIALSAALAVLAASCSHDADITCNRVEPLVKVFPEDVAYMPAEDTAHAAGNTHVEFAFALHPGAEVEGFSVTCSPFVSENGATVPAPQCGVVGYVGVGAYADNPAHDAIRRTSGIFPDPIIEAETYSLPAFRTFCTWITAAVPAGTAEGVYKGRVSMTGKCGGHRFVFERDVHIKVYPVSMRKPTFKTTNWVFDNDSCLKVWNNGEDVDRDSELYHLYIRQLADMLKGVHQTATKVNIFETVECRRDNEGHWKFDFSRFDMLVSMFKDAGVGEFVYGGDLGARVSPGWGGAAGLNVPDGKEFRQIATLPVSDPRVTEFYKEFIPALRSHLESKGWADGYVQQISDEPSDLNIDSYRAAVALVRRYWPDIKVLEACQVTDRAVGAINIWCPQLDHWHNGYDFFRSRQNAGEEVWFYTCCYPRGEYPNRFIEQPLIKGRVMAWMAFKYKADGYLHWGFNYWNEDPYSETSVPGAGTVLPGGDSWLIYPGVRRMYRSIRYEEYRDGIEDLTLLQMLEEHNPQKAQELADRMVFNWWNYCTSPAQFHDIRKSLLESLSSYSGN